jgi:hypothetical protein
MIKYNISTEKVQKKSTKNMYQVQYKYRKSTEKVQKKKHQKHVSSAIKVQKKYRKKSTKNMYQVQ